MSSSKVKGQGHQGQQTRLALPTPAGAYEWYALAAKSVQQQRRGPFRGCHGVLGSCVVRQWENQRMLSSLAFALIRLE